MARQRQVRLPLNAPGTIMFGIERIWSRSANSHTACGICRRIEGRTDVSTRPRVAVFKFLLLRRGRPQMTLGHAEAGLARLKMEVLLGVHPTVGVRLGAHRTVRSAHCSDNQRSADPC